MFPDILWVVPPGAAAVPVSLALWHHWSPQSWSYGPGLVGSAARVVLTWDHVAQGCGLSRTRKGVRRENGRLRRVSVEKKPRLTRFVPTSHGFRVRIRLHDGQTPDDYEQARSRLAHAWRVDAVRLHRSGPGWVELAATRRDPLDDVARARRAREPGGLLAVQLGVLETGAPWVLDFRVVPHWLDTGATQSGKSTDVNALIYELAARPVALVGLDLKGGVELTPYEPRMSKLATTRSECVPLLEGLLGIMEDRMALLREYRVRNIWKLPDAVRPVPIITVVDEVAELYLMADRSEKDQISQLSTLLLRIAQLGAAFGLYLFVCGQRVGSDLGPGVTALRAQLGGRICHRVADDETAKMTLGDVAPGAITAARAIPAEMPGVAVEIGADGVWHRGRSFPRTEEEAEQSAREHAHLTPTWASLLCGDSVAGLPEPAPVGHGASGWTEEAA